MTKQKAGFTLIELLVVVLIIGILAAVALPQYQKVVTKTRLANLKSLMETVGYAQERYYLENNNYTWQIEELDVPFPTPQHVDERTNDRTIYEYTWGKCWIRVNTIACYNSQVGIGTAKYYENASSGNRNGKRECFADTQNSISNQVCRQETGQTTPFYTGSNASLDNEINAYSYD